VLQSRLLYVVFGAAVVVVLRHFDGNRTEPACTCGYDSSALGWEPAHDTYTRDGSVRVVDPIPPIQWLDHDHVPRATDQALCTHELPEGEIDISGKRYFIAGGHTCSDPFSH
jgi:hypothetical protein